MGFNIRELTTRQFRNVSKFFSLLSLENSQVTEKFNMNYMKYYSYKLLNKWRILDNIVCVIACIGFVFSLIEYELGFSRKRTHLNCENSEVLVLRCLVALSSFVASIFVFFRYKVQRLFYRIQSKNPYKGHYRHMFKRRSFLLANLVLEMIILWVFPIPGVKFEIYVEQVSRLTSFSGKERVYTLCYTYAEIAFISMGIRFYFVLKFVLNSSSYRDMFSSYYCNKFNTRAGFRFALKSLVVKHEYKVFFFIVFPSLLLLAEALRVFERPYSDLSELNFDSYQNAIWCLITTMSTVGFGDLYPETNGGRFVCLISTFWGGFSLSWVIIFLSSWVYLSPEEEMTLEKINKARKEKKENSELGWRMNESVIGSSMVCGEVLVGTKMKKKGLAVFVNRMMLMEEKLDNCLIGKS